MGLRAGTRELKRWLAFGTGVGIEVGTRDLRVTVARVRPSGARVLGATVIEDFRRRPAAEWGAEYADFTRKLGVSHMAATVVLPRRDVIARVLALPGVRDRDLAAAIGFQIEALHPFAEEEATWAWSRLDGAGNVLVAVARRQLIAQYAGLFAEAGIKCAAFTFSAAAVYSALRLWGGRPAGSILAIRESEEGLEIYGESEARPVFSAEVQGNRYRAAAMAAAELRLGSDADPVDLAGLLPLPKRAPAGFEPNLHALAYAAALAGACPRLSLSLNLLPPEQRVASSRWVYVPTAALLIVLSALGIALAAVRPLEDRRYLAALRAEIARLEPQARKAAELDAAIETERARARLLDEFRRRTKRDLDVLAELTRLLAPPAWLNQLEVTRDSVSLAGDAEQAAGLLRVLDESPMFRNSEFTMPIARVGQVETFRIRCLREGEFR